MICDFVFVGDYFLGLLLFGVWCEDVFCWEMFRGVMLKESMGLFMDKLIFLKYVEEIYDLVFILKEKKIGKVFFDDDVLEKKKGVCFYYFGVRFYFYNFYDLVMYKDFSIYEEDDDNWYFFNLYVCCWWCCLIWLKVCIWIGVNFLVLGVFVILVGYFILMKFIICKGDV